jgi:hypothetical protein
VPIGGENIGNAYVRILADGDDFGDSVDDELSKHDKDFDDSGKRHGRKYGTSFSKESLHHINTLADHMSDRLARVFGKGSRNDFLNIFGRLVGRFASLLTLPLKGLEALVKLGKSFGDAFQAGGGIGVLTKLASTLGLVAATAAVTAVVLGGVATIMGILSSAVLTVVGALVAMTASLAFAASGGALVLLGALTPLIAGIGVATLAIMNMDKETKKAFEGIGDSLKILGKDAAGNIFDSAAKDAEALKKAVEGLGVITGPVSKALGGLLDEFIDSLDSPFILDFQRFLGQVLPDMVTSLGHIFGNLGSALAGVFRGIAPSVQEFLDWLEEITNRFSEWANSAEGQTSIADFMDRAKESAEAVGDALGQVLGLIGDLFDVSKDSGDNIFTSIADEVERWREALAKASEDGTIQKWFEDAKKTAGAIALAVVEVGKFVEALDTKENRALVEDLADGFRGLLKVVAVVSPLLQDAFNMLVPIGNAIEAIKQLKKAFSDLGGTFRTIYNSMLGPVLSTFLKAVAAILRQLGSLFGALASIPGAPAWIGKTADALSGAADKTDTLAEAIRNIPDAHVDVTGPSQATINKIDAQLGYLSRDRTATITINTRLTGHPGPGAGGQDDTSDRSVYDPAVSQFTAPTTTTTGGTLGGTKDYNGRTVSADGWTIVTPTTDPEAVAAEVFNRLAGAGY